MMGFSDAGGGDALDAIDSRNGPESLLELLTDTLDVVDDEGGVDFHHSEDEGLDLGLVGLDGDALGNDLGDGGEDGVDVGLVTGGQDVVDGVELDHESHLKDP